MSCEASYAYFRLVRPLGAGFSEFRIQNSEFITFNSDFIIMDSEFINHGSELRDHCDA